jgi:hypothetical protein
MMIRAADNRVRRRREEVDRRVCERRRVVSCWTTFARRGVPRVVELGLAVVGVEHHVERRAIRQATEEPARG